MTRSYKSFRREGFSVRPDVYDRKKDGQPMTPAEKRQRDRDIEEQSKEDFSSLLELRDILDELNTLRKLFDEQRDTLINMAKHYKTSEGIVEAQSSTPNLVISIPNATEAQKQHSTGLKYIEEAEKSLDSFEKHVIDMIKDAENAEKAVSSFLPFFFFNANYIY